MLVFGVKSINSLKLIGYSYNQDFGLIPFIMRLVFRNIKKIWIHLFAVDMKSILLNKELRFLYYYKPFSIFTDIDAMYK